MGTRYTCVYSIISHCGFTNMLFTANILSNFGAQSQRFNNCKYCFNTCLKLGVRAKFVVKTIFVVYSYFFYTNYGLLVKQRREL